MNIGICPYPGLRPFTEEESIFFKGRDLHIRQIAKLLEENKMAFITGASGDGKSSMVYAGVIPYIRAGFFKADFNKWLIAEFKPKRNPLKSLSEALAKEMGIDADNCMDELDNGFSSVTDIYVNNGFYVKQGEDAVNKGKNLLIIADQFEEIFTNSDNFDNGVPSDESYTTVNLLLETVRIAVAENLPVYVIFTMRSDYISQCTVFKSLPEFIAYSQFFVPQLKRTEITQVIEEPAKLAGASVAPRLTEVLVNNLANGFDYLPVLQHIMNRLWEVAENGSKQLDLIHLAKIAGISPEMLPLENQKEFNQWFSSLSVLQKKYFEKPSLSNVLNAHAGILFDSAYDYFQNNVDWASKNITRQEAELIIETTFKSLVKIDNGRPVRNRCTLDEITGSVNREHITNAVVCGCINIFRLPQNTLLRPFIENNNFETQYLSGDSVLDITHEALIRNWRKLAQWNSQEDSFVKDYYDLKSQLSRWKDNGRRKEFLLPEGNLIFFENWKQNCNLNSYWIAKYDTSKLSEEEKINSADTEYKNICEFLNRSRQAVEAQQNHKKRKQKIILAVVLVGMFILAGFTFWALKERNNAKVESLRANEKTKEVEYQMTINEQEKKRAVAAEQMAETERLKAVTEAGKARIAQENAEVALREANAARILADSMRNIAQKNLTSAENARLETEQALVVAKEQTKKADAASDSVRRLYNTAVSNALAMKAQNHYEDKSMNLRLAWSAWLMCRDCGLTRNTAELYQAMLYAMAENGFDNKLEVTNDVISDFYITKNNNLMVVTQNAEIIGYKISGDKPKEYQKLAVKEATNPIQKAVFLSDNTLLFCTKDKKMFFVDLSKQNVVSLTPQGYFNSAFSKSDNSKTAIAMNDGNVFVWNSNSITKEPDATLNFNEKISDIKIDSNNNLYVLMHKGKLLKCDINSNKTETLLDKSPSEGFSLALIDDKNLIAASFADKNITYINLETNDAIDILGSNAKLGIMAYNKKSGLLARTSADKRILIVDTDNFLMQPYTIEEYNLNGANVNSLRFNNKGVLFVLTELNEIRYWDTDINQYAKSLATLKLKPLSDREKQSILGNEFVGEY